MINLVRRIEENDNYKNTVRMSFFGGGTDMENFFKEKGDSVLSTTFDKYCYVNVTSLASLLDYSTECPIQDRACD